MTLPKCNNSTVTNINDSEMDENPKEFFLKNDYYKNCQ
jgi:hypothetical protein